jgi:hypothetical protein
MTRRNLTRRNLTIAIFAVLVMSSGATLVAATYQLDAGGGIEGHSLTARVLRALKDPTNSTIVTVVTVIAAVVAALAAAIQVAVLVRRDVKRRRLEERVDMVSDADRDDISDELWRLREFTARRHEAEEELARYLPANPRQAKRLINHLRLFALIAEDRGIFGGEPELTHRHLAKWTLISEHWSGLAAILTLNPAAMQGLERAASSADLAIALDGLGCAVPVTDELFAVLHSGTMLAPVLERLVRFEPAATLGPARRLDLAGGVPEVVAG